MNVNPHSIHRRAAHESLKDSHERNFRTKFPSIYLAGPRVSIPEGETAALAPNPLTTEEPRKCAFRFFSNMVGATKPGVDSAG